MNKNNYKFFAAELGAKMLELDLHGLWPADALEKLEIFLYECVEKRENMARIIYGGGTGKLREAVLSRIEKHPLVESWKEEGGGCVVLL